MLVEFTLQCGTSWHAGLIGKTVIEEYARIPVHVDYASEFRYREPIIDSRTVLIAISQSGETADTLAAIKAKSHGALVLGICNVVEVLFLGRPIVVFTRMQVPKLV